MTYWTLISRSLRFYRRTHLGVVLGAAAATAALVGALVVGDSVRHSLRRLALGRLGGVHVAMASGDRYFRHRLAGELSAALGAPAAAVLELGGVASSDAGGRANNVQVLGVDEGFWRLGGGGPVPGPAGGEVVINRRLASHLNVKAGAEIVLRVPRPSLLPRDAPLASDRDASLAFRLTVRAVASDEQFGRFSLKADQVAPYNAFVPLKWLQERAHLPGKANLLLAGAGPEGEMTPQAADAALRRHWRLADAELELRELPEAGVLELRSGRVFLDPPVAAAADDGAVGVLTYFVNEIRAGKLATPYSMVAAMGPLRPAGRPPRSRPAGAVPADVARGEILINQWLADDLQAQAGDEVELRYFVLGRLRKLQERSSRFGVRAVLPLKGAAADPTLMPEFPGVAVAQDCKDWKPGIPIDFDKIRPKDEQYWDDHRGAPKAFVALADGQEIWGNRFGDLTAVRWPLAGAQKDRVAASIRASLAPASVGLFFQPVRRLGLRAGAEGVDFGWLFFGLSFFLIAAAVLLMGLLFVFGIEQRSGEVGTLLALGFPPGRVRRLLLAEGGCLAAAGVAVGTPAGLLYTRALLGGLGTLWSGAVAGSTIRFHVTAATLAIAAGASLLAAAAAMWAVLWRQGRVPASALLAQGAEFESLRSPRRLGRSRGGLWIGLLAAGGAAAVLVAWGRGTEGAVGAFFAAGGLLLVAAVGLSQAAIAAAGRAAPMTLAGLGVRNAARRAGRSLATVSLLACGVFLIVAIGAFRRDAAASARQRSSGTGGFALLGETALPVLHDLNSPGGRKAFRLSAAEMAGAAVVPLRVRAGDDASCLNLNRAQRPRLLGVDPEALHARRAFTFIKTAEGYPPGARWRMLAGPQGEEVPAVGDQATVVWALGKSVGETVDYTDERGRPVKLRIVGMIADSILQGALVISERDFTELFATDSGYHMLLVDAAPEAVARVQGALARAGEKVGLELTPAPQRLAEFNVVQNTYLSIFQVLGGLGLLLGSVGLGVVLMRNVLHRRGELALMRAVGFPRSWVHWLLLVEHWGLLALGLGGGVAAGLLAVAPALRTPGTEVPYVWLASAVGAVASAGAAWTLLATVGALRGPLVPALRSE